MLNQLKYGFWGGFLSPPPPPHPCWSQFSSCSFAMQTRVSPVHIALCHGACCSQRGLWCNVPATVMVAARTVFFLPNRPLTNKQTNLHAGPARQAQSGWKLLRRQSAAEENHPEEKGGGEEKKQCDFVLHRTRSRSTNTHAHTKLWCYLISIFFNAPEAALKMRLGFWISLFSKVRQDRWRWKMSPEGVSVCGCC